MRWQLATLALTLVMLAPQAASAVPAFSRQIHADCRTCHFQGMGSLNAFGRAFMMNNFSLSKRMRQQLRERQHKRKDGQKQPSPDKRR